MLDGTQIRNGNIIRFEGGIWKVISSELRGTAKFGKTVHAKIHNLENGHVVERSFKGDDRFDEVEVRQVKMQYLYREGGGFVFMNEEDYEQYPLPAAAVGKQEVFLSENSEVTVLFADEKAVSVDFPKFVELKVTSAPGGGKGGGDSNTYREVELENGLKILAPHFVKEGETVRVNTGDCSYSERVTTKSMK